jgi:hypothetical protein
VRRSQEVRIEGRERALIFVRSPAHMPVDQHPGGWRVGGHMQITLRDIWRENRCNALDRAAELKAN